MQVCFHMEDGLQVNSGVGNGTNFPLPASTSILHPGSFTFPPIASIHFTARHVKDSLEQKLCCIVRGRGGLAIGSVDAIPVV